MISGEPGSGKTVLGLEFLYRGALVGEPGIYVGFEEPASQVRENCATLGWELEPIERENRLFLYEGQLDPETILSGEFSIRGLLAGLSGKAREMGARRVVLDALDVILRIFGDPLKARNEMHLLNNWLRSEGLTSIMTVRPQQEGQSGQFEHFFFSMCDCVISLTARVQNQVSTRRLRVLKYRGSSFGRNEYPYVITEGGIQTAPISTVGLRHKPLGEKVFSGIPRLDEMLAGGYRRASACSSPGRRARARRPRPPPSLRQPANGRCLPALPANSRRRRTGAKPSASPTRLRPRSWS